MTNKEVRFIPISAKVSVHLSFEPELQLPTSIEEAVERLWRKAKEEDDGLNPAPLFCLSSFDSSHIFARFVEKRYYVASCHKHELRQQLQVFPLCVRAVIVCNDSLLVTKRSDDLFELMPKGEIERRAIQHGEVDFIRQLMWLLEENAYIGEKRVKGVHLVGLFFDEAEASYNLVMKFELDLSEYEMVELETTWEEPLLMWMEKVEWEKALRDNKIDPVSQALWMRCKEI